MFDKKLFGLRIRQLRHSRKISLKDVAEALGTLKGSISNIERGEKSPSVDMMLTLADFFDVSLDYLVGRSDNPRRYGIPTEQIEESKSK